MAKSTCCGVHPCCNYVYSDGLDVKAKGQKRIFVLECCGIPICYWCFRCKITDPQICKFCKKQTFARGIRKTSCKWSGPCGIYEERREYMELYYTFSKNSPDFYDKFFGYLPIRDSKWRNLRNLTQYFGEKHRSIWRMFMFFATRRKMMRFIVQSSTFDELITMQNYVELNPRLKYPPTDRSAMFYFRMLVKYCHFGIFEMLVLRMALPMIAMPMMSRQNIFQLQQKLMKMIWRYILKVIASKVSWNLCL